MANSTAYLSHIFDFPSKVFWVQGESSHKRIFFSMTSSIGLIVTRSQKPSNCVCVCVCVCVCITQSCPTLSDLMDCSLQGSSIHGIFQARVLEWGAIA